jgi:hypothetical protein
MSDEIKRGIEIFKNTHALRKKDVLQIINEFNYKSAQIYLHPIIIIVSF